MFKVLILSVVLSFFNCNSSKQITAPKDDIQSKAVVQTENDTQMKNKGFKKGTLQVNKATGCPYVLIVDQYTDKLDPINLSTFFKGNNIPKNVWVIYENLRMPNRCNDARPVSITEIQERKE